MKVPPEASVPSVDNPALPVISWLALVVTVSAVPAPVAVLGYRLNVIEPAVATAPPGLKPGSLVVFEMAIPVS